jgi:hypothetical protein
VLFAVVEVAVELFPTVVAAVVVAAAAAEVADGTAAAVAGVVPLDPADVSLFPP